MSRRSRSGTLARRWPRTRGKVSARGRRWSTSTIVFALLAVSFAVLSATAVQRVQQLANELEEAKRRFQEAEARNVKPSGNTP